MAAELMSSLNLSNPSWDLFIILFFVIAALLYGFSLGRDRIIVILISTYMALAVVTFAPFIGESITTSLGIEQLFAIRISAFVGVFVILFFLLSRSALLRTVARADDDGKWWQILLFSFLHVGLLISIVLSYLPPEFAERFTAAMRGFFISDTARFLWIVLPILAMIFSRGKKPRPLRDDDET
ncbi:hypothetical protein ACFL1U_01705 [Patescibacteria group bacterium]